MSGPRDRAAALARDARWLLGCNYLDPATPPPLHAPKLRRVIDISRRLAEHILLEPPMQKITDAPVLPSPAMPRGGARPGAGRKPRDPSGASKTRPGVPMTDEEWAAVVAYAEREGVSKVEACRRLIAMGLRAAGD